MKPIIEILDIIQRSGGDAKVDIMFMGTDLDRNVCDITMYEYSLTGAFAGEEAVMTIDPFCVNSDGIDNLFFTHTGREFNLVWDAATDLGTSLNDQEVFIRLKVNDSIEDSDIASDSVNITTDGMFVDSYAVDTGSEVEPGATIDGVVSLSISATNADYMSFSNNGIKWTDYEAYNSTKSGWNLIDRYYGGLPTDGVKKTYIKLKDSGGNETDGTLFASIWYKKSEMKVKNEDTTTMYHTIGKAVADASENDTISISGYEVFYESFDIDTNGISIIADSEELPNIDMRNECKISVTGDDVLIRGIEFASRARVIVSNCSGFKIDRCMLRDDSNVVADSSTDICVNRNTFRDGISGVYFKDCLGEVVFANNLVKRLMNISVGILNTECKIIGNTMIDCGVNIRDFTADAGYLRNNIIVRGEVGISANPTWEVLYNNIWANDNNYEGLYDRTKREEKIGIYPLVPKVPDRTFDISTDPLFVDYGDDDFHLVPESECFNKGQSFADLFSSQPLIDYLSYDREGILRKQDYQFEMGAYEHFPVPEAIYNIDNVLHDNDVRNVFVYDLSKDDASTAWQHDYLAWGVGSKFPDIAFLVVTDNALDIIDASDDSLWMRFESGADNVIDVGGDLKTVFALNGIVYVNSGKNGSGDYTGMAMIRFTDNSISKISDSTQMFYDSGIIDRNNGSGYSSQLGYTSSIVDNDIYDIHADYLSGSQRIAAGTNAGVSVLYESVPNTFTVQSYADGNVCENVWVTENDHLYYSDNTDDLLGVFYDISEGSGGTTPDAYYSTDSIPDLIDNNVNDIFIIPGKSPRWTNVILVATDGGITKVVTDETYNGMFDENGTDKHYGFESSKHYGLIGSVDPNIDAKIIEGSISEIKTIFYINDLVLFSVNDENNGYLFAFDERVDRARLIRTTSLPSRKVSSLSGVQLL